MRYLAITSNAPEANTLVLVDGPPYTPWVVIDRNLGNDTWTHQRSGPSGTQGRAPSAGTPDDRVVRIALRLSAESTDDLAARLSDLQSACDELRRFGGRITYRLHGQSYRQHLTVLEGACSLEEWGKAMDLRFQANPLLTATCAPYASGDPMDADVEWGDVDDLTSFTGTEDGALSNVTVAGGVLVPAANPADLTRLLFTQRGYPYTDHTQTVAFTPPSTLGGFRAGLVAKTGDLGSTYIECYVSDDGTASTIHIDKVVGAARTSLGSDTITRLAPGVTQFLWLDIVGVQLRATISDTDPFLLPGFVAPYVYVTLAGADVDTFGPDAGGTPGLTWTPVTSAASIGAYRLRAYRDQVNNTSVAANSQSILRGVPGDAPPLAEVRLENAGSAFGQGWCLLAWSRKPPTYNMCWNGAFEDVYDVGAITPRGWSAAGVSGITGAATSILYASGASYTGWSPKYGLNAAVVQTGATANVGAAFKLYGDFRAGVTYTAVLWARSVAATGPVRMRFGAVTDVASEVPIALSGVYTKHLVQWTPFSSAQSCYVAIEQTTGVAQKWLIDGVQVYEGSAPPTLTTQTEGRGAVPPIGVVYAASAAVASGLTVNGDNLRVTSPPTGGATYTAAWRVDPALLLADDYTSGEVEVEVWAEVSSAVANGDLTVSVASASRSGSVAMSTTPSREGARVLHDPDGLYRLGTVAMTIGDSAQQEWLVQLTVVAPASGTTGLINVGRLFLAPSRSRALRPTGAASGSDVFLPGSFGYSLAIGFVRVIRSDLSGLLGTNHYSYGPASGMLGSLLELSAGDVVVHRIICEVTPETGITGSSAGPGLAVPQFSITPRWGKLRDN